MNFSQEYAIQFLLSELCDKYKGNPFIIQKIILNQLQLMNKPEYNLDFSGYNVFKKFNLLNNCCRYIENYGCKSKYTLKNIIQIILFFQKLSRITLHNRYKPGGFGYYKSKKNFYNVLYNYHKM